MEERVGAGRDRLVHPGTDVRRANRGVTMVPAVSVIAILLAFAGWTWSTVISAFIPLAVRFLPPGRWRAARWMAAAG